MINPRQSTVRQVSEETFNYPPLEEPVLARATLAAIAAPSRVTNRHGTEASAVLAHDDRDPTLLGPVAPGVGARGAATLHALRVDGTLTVEEILDRRTRIGLVPADRAVAATAVQTVVTAERQATAP